MAAYAGIYPAVEGSSGARVFNAIGDSQPLGVAPSDLPHLLAGARLRVVEIAHAHQALAVALEKLLGAARAGAQCETGLHIPQTGNAAAPLTGRQSGSWS